MKIRQFEFNMFGVNTYVAWDTATLDAVVIDPGMIDDNECRRFDSFIAERGLKLTRMLFTHLHLDHTFGSDYIASHYGLKAEGHEADGFLGEQRASQAAMFHISREMTSLKLDRFIDEGSIAVGDDSLEVLHVPGHSPGQCGLLQPFGWMGRHGRCSFQRLDRAHRSSWRKPQRACRSYPRKAADAARRDSGSSRPRPGDNHRRRAAL